ncbi:MAG TPA: hypothetical protein VHB72_00390 [Candidatus Saccharimonadales bacterium]|nr:hypothetical protein [Candidatus Saccharimonadales bacterium]
MNPSEIDYASTSPSYFDLSTGEVLVDGETSASEDHGWIVPIGMLLRSPDLFVEPGNYFYERLNTKEWSPDQFKAFARWIGQVIEPPENLNSKKVTVGTFRNAHRLGLGPSERTVQREYGGYSKLYADAQLEGVQTRKLFDDWSIDDVIAYLKKIGNGSTPTRPQLAARQRKDPNNPGHKYLHERFHDIGGFNKLLELAGYPVVRLWEKPDYVDWGVRFMLANGGKKPTSSMINYLSLQEKGPSFPAVAGHFDSLPNFQAEVAAHYYERRDEEEAARQEQFAQLDSEFSDGTLPLMLFSPFAYDSPDAAFTESVVNTLYDCEQPCSRIIAALGERETIIRYAKFQVLRSVAPNMTDETKIKIARNIDQGRGFIAAIRRKRMYDHLTPADIESEALFLGVFDFIWPVDGYMDSLKLDKGYEEFLKKQSTYKSQLRAAKKNLSHTQV